MAITLEDRVEIDELVARYNFAIDHFDAEAWADLFTEDGALIFDGKLRARGRTNLFAFIDQRRGGRYPAVRHWTTNHLIDGDGKRARFRAYLMSFDISDGVEAPRLMGEYDDELVKVDGVWKFHLRRVVLSAIKRGLQL